MGKTFKYRSFDSRRIPINCLPSARLIIRHHKPYKTIEFYENRRFSILSNRDIMMLSWHSWTPEDYAMLWGSQSWWAGPGIIWCSLQMTVSGRESWMPVSLQSTLSSSWPPPHMSSWPVVSIPVCAVLASCVIVLVAYSHDLLTFCPHYFGI